MKRKDIVKKLLKEGISRRTLIDLNDKQLNLLFNRINEQEKTQGAQLNISKKDTVGIENAKREETPFMTYEEEGEEIEDDDKFHPMTTKEEISEMVKSKLKKIK
jgi:hypothetical protein